MADEGPKIIIDSDWKAQARAEKERLVATEKPKAAPPPGAAAPSPGAGQPSVPAPAAESRGQVPELPEANFEELVRMVATQALLYMGAFPDPETGRAMVSLELAKLNVDLLAVLEEKTKGNLTEQESRILTGTLYELRMQYVEVTKAVARAVEQGRIGRAPGAAPGMPPVQ